MDAEAEAEALAALSIDDTLSDLQRLEKYSASEIALQRLFQVKGLNDALGRIGREGVMKRVVPILVSLADDVEPPVRHAVAEQLGHVAVYLFELGSEGYQIVLNQILPTLSKLIVDVASQEVRASSEDSLVKVCNGLSVDHLASHVLAFVLMLAHDEEKDQNRAIATQLLGRLSHSFGRELCRSYVVAELISLSDDDIFRVRKSAASHLSLVCEVVGEDYAVQRLLPVYSALAEDDIWGVRKACAENLVQMSESLPLDERATHLIPRLDAFLSDVSRWVRNATFSILGHFLSTLRPQDISSQLLANFAAMADPESLNGDSEMTYSCAFHFPGVLLTVGKERWGELERAYTLLAKDSRWKVRRCLALSIHVVANLVGRETTENIILPIFDSFLQDIDEVRFAAVQNLAGLLREVGDDCRRRYFATLNSLQAETDNWRFRRALAEQLVNLAELYSPEDVSEHLLPLAITVCQDPFASVRCAACSALVPILKRINDDTAPSANEHGTNNNTAQHTRLAQCVPRVTALSTHESYHIRLSFVLACTELLCVLPVGVLEEYFMPPLLALRNDPVPNIRLALARELISHTKDTQSLREHPQIAETLRVLANDPDMDVSFFAVLSTEKRPVGKYNGRKGNAKENSRTNGDKSDKSSIFVAPPPIAQIPASVNAPGTPRGPPQQQQQQQQTQHQ